MTEPFTIRRYQPSDRESCRSLWRALTEWHRRIYRDPFIGGEHPEDYFDEHLAKVRPDRLWVAVHDSRVVGLVGLILNGEEAEIEPLIVSEAYRHQGIGKKLIGAVVSEAENLEIRFLNVKPVARNVQAIKFLHGQDFKTLGHMELFM
ncbi:GNAT family N-acetyltransferase, partial [Candidatus Bathyarchaeota archaeon]|nr:GNAT family N-acetyltransferase [Candidatus Bathyarchaeota archaeon]NIU80650.1 GNAT family N-acetyltransferase [Candidatus Bathyarchaeota archaeon]NIV67271.1 GNAT family N-acetyltransferase [Candidatus Bathyarchaeota archaeon]NIW15837.1 GNAT family N-acetyltransferase [Candidatus Bathyarchaeota archaeon]NIW33959.1 GNAT family N-acetyltransferase [Candidatus Bathyarchaeota archaeon]